MSKDEGRAAIFGSFDGATSSFGLTFAMFAQHHRPVDFIAPVVGLAVASAAGMGGGEAESTERSGMLTRSLVMAGATFAGVVLVALPFMLLRGTLALAGSLALAFALALVLAEQRSRDLGRSLSYRLTFGVLIVAIGASSAIGVALPGAGG